MAEPAQQTIREAVGVFHDRGSFQSAVENLMSAGFDRAELSLLAGARAIEEKLGHAYRKIQELEDDPTVPRAAYVGNHSLAEGRTGVTAASRTSVRWPVPGPWSPPAARSPRRSPRRPSPAVAAV
jgi:hypothetical protein